MWVCVSSCNLNLTDRSSNISSNDLKPFLIALCIFVFYNRTSLTTFPCFPIVASVNSALILPSTHLGCCGHIAGKQTKHNPRYDYRFLVPSATTPFLYTVNNSFQQLRARQNLAFSSYRLNQLLFPTSCIGTVQLHRLCLGNRFWVSLTISPSLSGTTAGG